MAKQGHATIETKLHEDGAVSHKINFANGESDVVVIKPGHELAQQFIAHGSRAKIQAAINSGDSADGAVKKVAALGKAFDEGRWTMIEGSGKPKGTVLARALAALKGCEIEEAEAFVKGLTKAQQAKVRGTPAVMAKIAELNAAEAAPDESLLGGFLGTDEQETSDAAQEQSA